MSDLHFGPLPAPSSLLRLYLQFTSIPLSCLFLFTSLSLTPSSFFFLSMLTHHPCAEPSLNLLFLSSHCLPPLCLSFSLGSNNGMVSGWVSSGFLPYSAGLSHIPPPPTAIHLHKRTQSGKPQPISALQTGMNTLKGPKHTHTPECVEEGSTQLFLDTVNAAQRHAPPQRPVQLLHML